MTWYAKMLSEIDGRGMGYCNALQQWRWFSLLATRLFWLKNDVEVHHMMVNGPPGVSITVRLQPHQIFNLMSTPAEAYTCKELLPEQDENVTKFQ
jgi:hypothetical protein